MTGYKQELRMPPHPTYLVIIVLWSIDCWYVDLYSHWASFYVYDQYIDHLFSFTEKQKISHADVSEVFYRDQERFNFMIPGLNNIMIVIWNRDLS